MKHIYDTPFENADAYKLSHWQQYPTNVTKVYSNLTPRKSRIPSMDRFVVFGVRYALYEIVKRFEDFFGQPEDEAVADFQNFMLEFFGAVSEDSLAKVRALHKLRYLPIEVKALDEGSLVPHGVPVITFQTTTPGFHWFTQFLETWFSALFWKPATSATTAYYYKRNFLKYAELTGSDEFFTNFQGHDFSFRGMSSPEDAKASGSGHLLSFMGTDTCPTLNWIEKYYPGSEGLIGTSVPATEHSVQTAFLEEDDDTAKSDLAYLQNTLNLYPTGIVSIVSDGYDFWRFVTDTVPAYKEQIMSRDGKLVIRPDCYDSETQILTSEGWKYFNDLSDSDLVAQVNTDKSYSFVKPTRIIKQDYNGNMIQISDHHGKIDLLVTPNHRIIHYTSLSNDIRVKEADKYCPNWLNKLLRSASAPNTGKHLSSYEKFLVALQADGSIKKINNSTTQVTFAFEKERKITKLRKILTDLPFEFTEKQYDSRKTQTVFVISIPNTYPIWKTLEWVDISDLCSNWCNEFLDELVCWDGSIRSIGRFKYDTTEKINVDVVEHVAIGAGRGCLVSVASDSRKEHFHNVFTAHIMQDPFIGGQAIKKKQVSYSGTVHCVEVPSGMILVKRNRGICVSGNSSPKTPVEIIIGDSEAPEGTPEHKGLIQCLYETFGGTTNSKGFIELDSHIGAIYGDSITLEYQEAILAGLMAKGFASSNIVLGIGSTYGLAA